LPRVGAVLRRDTRGSDTRLAGWPIGNAGGASQTVLIAAHPVANPGAGKGAADRSVAMLYYAAVFFIIALVAALFGFGGIAAGAVSIAKILFIVFAVLTVASLLLGLFRSGG